MRKLRTPVVDYRKLRLRTLGSPEFRHLKLLLGWAVYFALYFLTERLIRAENCHVIHCALDDRIPFCEGFVVFYVGWYLLILFSLAYFLLYDIPLFKKLQTYILLVQLLATAVYILYPSCQQLRPEEFGRDNVLTALVGLLYRIDTPTGVCPSLHVAISLGIASAWLREKTVKAWVKAGLVLFCLGVCVSVCFVKQHSVIDVFAAIPLWALGQWVAFCRLKC